MIPIDGKFMLEIAPHFAGANAGRQSDQPGLGIDTRLRIAHFLGQTCHESAGFRTTQEFASGDAYEGRSDLGNVKKGAGAATRDAACYNSPAGQITTTMARL
jgi:putative chitinase